MDDPAIKRALYPPVGMTPSSQKGGGKPKTDFQWQVCIELFGENPNICDSPGQGLALSGREASAASLAGQAKIKTSKKVSVSQNQPN